MVTNQIFSEKDIIFKYSFKDALEDGVMIKTGELQKSKLPVGFTSNLDVLLQIILKLFIFSKIPF